MICKFCGMDSATPDVCSWCGKSLAAPETKEASAGDASSVAEAPFDTANLGECGKRGAASPYRCRRLVRLR